MNLPPINFFVHQTASKVVQLNQQLARRGTFSNFRRQAQAGFTLIELIVTIALISIIVAWGAPSLQRLVESQRLKSAVSEFRSALTIARFESHGQGRRLLIAKNCAVNTILVGSIAANCAGNNWSDGFKVFVCRVNLNAADQDRANLARTSTARDCVLSPNQFIDDTAVTQDFEGFSRKVRLCAATNAGVRISTMHSILYNPNSTIQFSDGAGVFTARTFKFILMEEGGVVDLAHSFFISGNGHVTTKPLRGTDVNGTGLNLCEPV